MADRPISSQPLDPHAAGNLAHLLGSEPTLSALGTPVVHRAGAPELAPAAAPAIGASAPDLVIGNVTLKRLLGQGGMGEVFLGYHEGFKLPVAVKLLPARFGDGPMVERFLREAQVAVRLDHPNIVRVHDVGRDPLHGRIYMVMDYVEGNDLQQYERDHGGKLPVIEVVRLLAQAAHALAHAHAQGVTHRDIKPSNLMRRARDERLIVLDFGLSRALGLEPLTQGDQIMGTLPFMALEQIMGQGVPASDVYSLGVTLYRLLVGRHPASGDLPAMMAYHSGGGTPPPLAADLRLPPRLAQLVPHMLEHASEDRPAAADVAMELDAILVELGAKPSTEGKYEPIRNPRAIAPTPPAADPPLPIPPVVPAPTRKMVPARVVAALAFAGLTAAAACYFGALDPGAASAGASLRMSAAVLLAPPITRDIDGAEFVPLPRAQSSGFPRGTVHEKDGIRFAFLSDAPAHIYVFNIGTSGASYCLFPDYYQTLYAMRVEEGKAAGLPAVNPLAPKDGVILAPPIVPGAAHEQYLMWYSFNGKQGIEWFLLVAAAQPVRELDEIRSRLRSGGKVEGRELKELAARWQAELADEAPDAAGGAVLYHRNDGEKPLGTGWCSVRGKDKGVWVVDLEHQ